MDRSIAFCILTCSLSILLSCQNDQDSNPSENSTTALAKEDLVGTWETKYFKVMVITADGADSTYIFEVSEEYWEDRFQVKPVRTYFEPDNTYRTEYRGLNDSLVSVTRGMYNVFGDTLMLIEPEATYQYRVLLKEGQAHWRATIDWDGDGVEDDEYYSIQRRVARNTDY